MFSSEKCSSTPFSKYCADLKAANLINEIFNYFSTVSYISPAHSRLAHAQPKPKPMSSMRPSPILRSPSFLICSSLLFSCEPAKEQTSTPRHPLEDSFYITSLIYVSCGHSSHLLIFVLRHGVRKTEIFRSNGVVRRPQREQPTRVTGGAKGAAHARRERRRGMR